MSRKRGTGDVPAAFVNRGGLRGFQAMSALEQAWQIAVVKTGVEVSREKIVKRHDIVDPADWAMLYRRIQGTPFTFEYHRPLEAIYRDVHKHICVTKPAQVGATTWATARAIWYMDMGAQYFNLDRYGLSVGYLMPTNAKINKFVRTDVDVLRQESEYLEHFFNRASIDQNSQKIIGYSIMHLLGMQSEAALKSWPGDVLVFDEYDEMQERMIELARKRLNASKLRHEIDLSTPTLPDYGIDKQFRQSDQQIWHIECPNCHEWTDLEFFRDWRALHPERTLGDPVAYDVWKDWDKSVLRDADWNCYCPKCLFVLKQNSPGEWKPRNPDKRGRDPLIRGYQIPVLAFPTVDFLAIVLALTSGDAIKVAEAHRSNLGLPYLQGGAKLVDSNISELVDNTILINGRVPSGLRPTHVTMGVDVGSVFHYRISANYEHIGRVVIAMGRAASWDDLSKLIVQYRVSKCVVDHMPEANSCREFQVKHPHIVVRAAYSVEPKAVRYSEVNEDGLITIQRTVAHEDVFGAVIGHAEIWTAECASNSEVLLHMCAPYRTTRLNARTGEIVAHWDHGGVPDHFFHASIYDRCASSLIPQAVGTGRVAIVTTNGGAWGLGNRAPEVKPESPKPPPANKPKRNWRA